MRGSVAAIAVAILLVMSSKGFGQNQPNFSIYFSSPDGPPPQQVVVEGGEPFQGAGGNFVYSVPQPLTYQTFDIVASRPGRSLPLRVVAKRDASPIRIRAVLSNDTICDLRDVQAVYSRRVSTIDERLTLVARAKELLDMGNCAERDLWKLAKRYFDTSCALASDPRSKIDLSPDAQDTYRRLAKTRNQKQEAETCTGKAQQRALRSLQSDLVRYSSEKNLEAYEATYRELITHSENESWSTGFSALRIDGKMFHKQWVDELFRFQNRLSQMAKYDEAIEVNLRLSELVRHPDYEGLAYLDRNRLCGDRIYFINLRDKSNITVDECLLEFD